MKQASALMRRHRSTPSERAQWVRRFHQSGLTPREFARQHHLKLSTLQRWIRQNATPPPALTFAEVTLPGPTPAWAAELIRPDGARLRLAAHAPAPWFEALLRRY